MMTRSFTDRVLAGVCGGLARSTHINAWIWRVLFVGLAVLSQGGFLAAYVILWWIVPQQSPATRVRGVPVILVLLLLALTAFLWVLSLQGVLVSDAGASLYLPILLVVTATVYLLRQIRLTGRGT